MTDLTKLDKPYGKLPQRVQDALREAWQNGHEIERFNPALPAFESGGWRVVENPLFLFENFYRLAPPRHSSPLPRSIADEAKDIVAGVRRQDYGTPERAFATIAKFWSVYLSATRGAEVVITAEDVSPMMRLMKEARLCGDPKNRDSLVDVIGYALTDAEIKGLDK